MPFAIDEITINLLVDIPENKSIIDTLFIEDSKESLSSATVNSLPVFCHAVNRRRKQHQKSIKSL
jgi:hypothetical protein